MDENGAQESGMDSYAQFNSPKALEHKFLKSNHWLSLAVHSPATKENQWLDFKNFFVYALTGA